MLGMQQDTQNLLARNNYRGIASSAIGSDAIGEEITLIDKAMQSSNYLPSVSGWRIDGYGDAEFANVFVRGDINAESGTIGYWNISSPLVKRTFGTEKLFGTFLESSDLGLTDEETTSGTYVGLYKSFIDEAVPVTYVLRVSELATLTAIDHNFQVGDLVDITVVTDATFSGIAQTITNVTTDTFSYVNTGTDTALTEVEGSATLSIEDVAGLYLKDYSKRTFDYGYISNKGLSYASAETLNLVYNPSFEYKETGTNIYEITAATSTATSATYSIPSAGEPTNPFVATQKVTIANVSPSSFNGSFIISSVSSAVGTWIVTVDGTFTLGATATSFGDLTAAVKPSVASWDTSSGSGVSSWTFIGSVLKDYATASSYGGSLSWTSSATILKFRGIIGYNTGNSYNLFNGSRPIYFNYDSFLNYYPFSQTISGVTVSTTSATAPITITTSGVHGLTIGDLVYLDLTAKALAVDPADGSTVAVMEFLYDSSKDSRVFTVTGVPTTTTFEIANPTGYYSSGGVARTARVSRDGITTRSMSMYSVVWPAIDLSEVSFVFPNSTSTTLYSILDSSTKAYWDASTSYKYKSINPNKWMLEYLDPVDGINPLLGSEIIIDGSILRDLYSLNDNTNFLLKNNIQILIPARAYSQTTANGYAKTYTSTTGSTLSATAAITVITQSTPSVGFVQYTANNNFSSGDYVTVTGAGVFNVTNVKIESRTSTTFVVTSSVTGASTTGTAKAYKTLSTVLDEVSISTEPVSFFGNTSDSYYWKDSSLNSPSQVSIQSPKKWISVDLDTQTGILTNLDYVEFKASYLSHPMLAKPSISAVYDSANIPLSSYGIYDYQELKTSSGVFSKANATDTAFINFEAYTRSITGDVSALSEVVATSYGATSSLRVYSGYMNNKVDIVASNISLTGAVGIVGVTTVVGSLIASSSASIIPMYVNIDFSSGTLISFTSYSTAVGSISFNSSGVVSYNSFLGSHYSEFSEVAPLKGTIMESTDELVEYKYAAQDRMAKTVVSNTPLSSKVYGVYLGVDPNEDGKSIGHLIAAIGAGWIRIASGASVQAGDLIQSNGDGCGRVQLDDIIRSSTVGKVTSSNVVETYEDGSYLVPCVLYCG
jgi:hypothetical protein